MYIEEGFDYKAEDFLYKKVLPEINSIAGREPPKISLLFFSKKPTSRSKNEISFSSRNGKSNRKTAKNN